MTKESKLYCDVMNAIANGKVSLFKVRQYKKVLRNIPNGMDQTPASHQMLFLSREKFNAIIERKKERFWSITKPFLIGLALVLITFFLSFFFLHNNTKITQPLPQAQTLKQPKDKNEVAPSSNQKTINTTQPQRK